MAWTQTTGSQTATLSTEHTIASPTTAGTYVFEVDTSNLVNGDAVELRVYNKIDGTNYRQTWKGSFGNVQINANKAAPPLALAGAGAKVSLRQIAGTFPITSLTGTIPYNSTVTGQTSGATAIIKTPGQGNVSGSTVTMQWLSGTFTNGETVQLSVGNNFVLTNATGRAFPWALNTI